MLLLEKLEKWQEHFNRRVWRSHASDLEAVDLADLLAEAIKEIRALKEAKDYATT